MVLESLLAELVDHRFVSNFILPIFFITADLVDRRGHPDALQALQRLNDLAKSGEV